MQPNPLLVPDLVNGLCLKAYMHDMNPLCYWWWLTYGHMVTFAVYLKFGWNWSFFQIWPSLCLHGVGWGECEWDGVHCLNYPLAVCLLSPLNAGYCHHNQTHSSWLPLIIICLVWMFCLSRKVWERSKQSHLLILLVFKLSRYCSYLISEQL